MSSRHMTRSIEMLAVNSMSASAGASAKRPCQSAPPPATPWRTGAPSSVVLMSACRGAPSRPARARRRAASTVPRVPGSATHISVSSPATVPSSPSSPLRSRADATTWAQPGGVRSTTRLPDAATSATHSPSTRRNWSTGAMRSLSMAGRAYTVWPPAARTLMTPSSSRSRDTVACVDPNPSAANSSISWGWLPTACWPISRAIACCRRCFTLILARCARVRPDARCARAGCSLRSRRRPGCHRRCGRGPKRYCLPRL